MKMKVQIKTPADNNVRGETDPDLYFHLEIKEADCTYTGATLTAAYELT